MLYIYGSSLLYRMSHDFSWKKKKRSKTRNSHRPRFHFQDNGSGRATGEEAEVSSAGSFMWSKQLGRAWISARWSWLFSPLLIILSSPNKPRWWQITRIQSTSWNHADPQKKKRKKSQTQSKDYLRRGGRTRGRGNCIPGGRWPWEAWAPTRDYCSSFGFSTEMEPCNQPTVEREQRRSWGKKQENQEMRRSVG